MTAGPPARRAASVSCPLRATLALILSLAGIAGCGGGPLISWPTAAGTPAPDGAAAWDAALAVCRDVRTFHGDVRVSGSVRGARLPSVLIGLQLTPTRIGMTATASGRTIFTMVGTAASADLHWTDGNRLLTAPAADIVSAVVGFSLGPRELLALASGCVAPDLTFQRAEQFDEVMVVTTGRGRVQLHDDDGWRILAAEVTGLGVRYRTVDGGIPRSWDLWSGDAQMPAVRLSLNTTGADVSSTERGAEAFPPVRAPGATPMTIEELRALVRRE